MKSLHNWKIVHIHIYNVESNIAHGPIFQFTKLKPYSVPSWYNVVKIKVMQFIHLKDNRLLENQFMVCVCVKCEIEISS